MQINEKLIHLCSCGFNVISQDSQIIGYCQDCTIYTSQQLSQQIMRLRGKQKFYQHKIQELERIVLQQKTIEWNQLIKKQKQQISIKAIVSVEYGQQQNEQILKLQNQLKKLEEILNYEKENKNVQSKQIKLLIDEAKQLQKKELQNQREYEQLVKLYTFTLLNKQSQLVKLKSTFERTNFVTIIYSITFEDDSSYLNGEKIIPDNAWKINQILRFYHRKYNNVYVPTVEICMDSMTLTIPWQIAFQTKSNNKNKAYKQFQQTKQIQIIDLNCDSETEVLQWARYVAVQIYQVFQFLCNTVFAEGTHKLKYPIYQNGWLEALLDKPELESDQLRKFNLTFKYLLSDLEQINKFQFFATQKRFKAHKQKNKIVEKLISQPKRSI